MGSCQCLSLVINTLTFSGSGGWEHSHLDCEGLADGDIVFSNDVDSTLSYTFTECVLSHLKTNLKLCGEDFVECQHFLGLKYSYHHCQ